LTKKLSELFELPLEEPKNELTEPIEQVDYKTTEAYTNLEKIENALPQVRGLEAADVEMDSLADMAKDSYNELMELGMQVDSRFASEIFNVAGTMLGHAITAKTAKINKKLKIIELQLKKAALDQKNADKDKEVQNIPLGEGHAIDRNELLKSLVNKSALNDK